MGAQTTTALMALALLAPGAAKAMNTDDVAGALGMLWRVREGACPTMSLDGDRFAAALAGGLTAADLRKRHAEAFDQGYAVAGEWLSEGGSAGYCQAVRDLFDGKKDFFGNAKAIPEGVAPGLTVRD